MKTKAKPSYRVRNWSQYDAALKQRGSLNFWLDEAVITRWINEQKTGRRGASNHYSDGAIALMATVQAVFNLPGRQTEGFLESLDLLQKCLNCHGSRSETSLRFLATLRFAQNDIHDFLTFARSLVIETVHHYGRSVTTVEP